MNGWNWAAGVIPNQIELLLMTMENWMHKPAMKKLYLLDTKFLEFQMKTQTATPHLVEGRHTKNMESFHVMMNVRLQFIKQKLVFFKCFSILIPFTIYSIKYRIDVYQTLNTISDPNDGPNKIISKTDETFENENGNYSLNMR